MDRKNQGKILVLVEGEKDDVFLMEHLLNIYRIHDRHQIVSYKTNIYVLYNQMFKDTNPEDMDILQVLKEHENNSEEKKKFDDYYSDILLIFDLDPQDPLFTPEKTIKMMKYFIESSDMGKLYLNYPMVESFYHMKSIPDKAYNSYVVSIQELRKKQYKTRVKKECRNEDRSKFAIDKNECDTVIHQNIDKAWLISGAEQVTDKIGQRLPDAVDILLSQLKKIREDHIVSVLCTCAFYIVDYNPKLIIY